MKVLSWNIRGGGGARLPRILEVMEHRSPEFIALQEVTPARVEDLRQGLRDLGYGTVDSISRVPRTAPRSRQYGVMVASIWPLVDQKVAPVPWPEKTITVDVQRPGGPFEATTLHAPPGSNHNTIKTQTFDAMTGFIRATSPRMRIICGDFNTPRREDPDGTIITWGRQNLPDAWDASERGILVGLRDVGLVDSFRSVHGYGVLAFSHRRPRKDKPPNLYRYDHCLASRELIVLNSTYLLQYLDEGISDHAPLEVVFE